MKDWLLGDWCYGSAKRAYERAQRNEARTAAAVNRAVDAASREAVTALGGGETFLLGTLPDGRAVRVAPREIGRHAMVWGASGAGKSYGLEVITEGWTASARRLELVDPKGETYLLKAIAAAARYRSLPEGERDAFAARFRVFDVSADRVTPVDLWSVPKGMSPALLASLRTAATCDVASHAISDLMSYGFFLIYSVAIHMGWGVTIRLVRAFFLDAAFRGRIAKKMADERLKDSVEHLETTLPEQTRKAIVRQFDILLAATPARVSFGLSPAMTRELLPNSGPTLVTLGNFGATPQRPPALAKAMATNRLIDVLTEVNVRPETVRELLLLEEVGVLVKQPAVAEYLLEASRTLRWKGLSIVCVAQDPANAIPKETVTALVLNSKWLLAFECGREEACWVLPHMAMSGKSESEDRRAFLAKMAKLPTQHAVFVRKGLPGLYLRLADIQDPTRRADRASLLDTFTTKIAARSMVRIAEAEERIERFEATLFDARQTPVTQDAATVPSHAKPASIGDFFALLDRARNSGGPG